MSQEDPKRLLEKATGGDSDALGQLVANQLPWLEKRVHSNLRNIRASSSEVDDLVQDTAYRFLKSPPQTLAEDLEGFRRQLAKTAYHLLTTQRRTHERRNNILKKRPADQTPGPEADDAASRSEDYHRIQEALRALSPDDRALLKKRFVEGLSINELADSIGISKSTAADRLERVKLRLLAKLLLILLAAFIFAGAIYVAIRVLSSPTERPTAKHSNGAVSQLLPPEERTTDNPDSPTKGGPLNESDLATVAPLDTESAPEEAPVFYGFVFDAATNNPIVDANCQLIERIRPTHKTQGTKTNTRGSFRFPSLGSGETGTLYFFAEGYAISVLEIDRPSTAIMVPMEPESVIRGIVLDHTGQPVAGAPITATGNRIIDQGPNRDVDVPETWLQGFTYFWKIRTNKDGRFEIRNLYPGDFVVKAHDPDDYERTSSEAGSSGSSGAASERLIIVLPE